MKTSGRKGSIIVDAACVLPVFVIAVSMLIGLIVQAGREESTVCLLKNASLAYCDACVAAELAEDFVPEGIAEGLGSLSDFVFRRSDEQVGELCVEGIVRIALPGKRFVRALTFRPFLGESRGAGERDDDRLVYIFPKYGIRYHVDGCVILERENHVLVRRSEAIEKGYTPCRICGGGEDHER